MTLAAIPPDLARDWVLPDGQRAGAGQAERPSAKAARGLETFVQQVTRVAPDAGGSAVTIEATSDTIVGAFREAAIYAVLAIAVILGVALRRLRDVLLVLAPLIAVGAADTAGRRAAAAAAELRQHHCVAAAAGRRRVVQYLFRDELARRAGLLLGSATARAILFSALTTGTAFGSLALSAHPGTASMGELLLISLGCTLLASLVFIPALLASLPRPHTGH